MMAGLHLNGRRPPKAADQHREWLTLVDTEGPFLAVPALTRVWPQGMPSLADAARGAISDSKPAFDSAWDLWSTAPESALPAFRDAREAWVRRILVDVVGWDMDSETTPMSATVTSPDHSVSVSPTATLGGDAALLWIIDPVASLCDPLDDGWSTTPIDRMELMLRAAKVPIGVLTDGRWWALVSAPPEKLAASGVVDALTWTEEPTVRNAFLHLIDPLRIVGGDPKDRLPALFIESIAAAEEITDSLGVQVRRAVELIVSEFSRASTTARSVREPDPLPEDGDEIYEAVVTVMMRIVFLLFAEQRGLLPEGPLFSKGYGFATQLDHLEERARNEGEEAIDGTHQAWHRLLATSTALHQGTTFEDMRLPAYGGSLFDPDRFPFLMATNPRGGLAITVSDRVMRAVLDAVQVIRLSGQDARRISFRDIDVEQIGYNYEGLLGYTCVRATTLTVGLIGKAGVEPEVPLAVLEDIAERVGDASNPDGKIAAAIIAWVKENQPASVLKSKSALTKALASSDAMEDAERALRTVAPGDESERDALQPWIGVIRRDLRGRLVLARQGDLLVIETASRRNAGAHYTPRDLAEDVVKHALEPLCFRPGPHQTNDHSAWRLLPPEDLLELRVADIACGSGAFLVAAARYLGARLVESWRQYDQAVHGTADEVRVQAIRLVVAHCLYGADINAMAVEMCKLSLWLVSLDRDQPFSFVDDKVIVGNSLLGLTSLRQLEELHITPHARQDEGRWTLTDGNELDLSLDIDEHVSRALRMRAALRGVIAEGDAQRDGRAKRRQLSTFRAEVAPLKRVADAVIATGLRLGGKPGKALDEAYADLRAIVRSDDGTADTLLARRVDAGLTPTVPTDQERWEPLHWPLEVPDVMERGGFDAIIGNPPFLGGQKLTGAMGSNLRDWFVHVLAGGQRGSADLVAYFFLRAKDLLHDRGTIGLIATNTVAQGDTREVGLDRMVDGGFTITRAIQSRSWPAKSANLEYAAVWGTSARVGADIERVCDDEPVGAISTLLEAEGRVTGQPLRLTANAGLAFQGCIVLGKGFIVEPDEAAEWIEHDPRNADVLFPYLNGEDLNSRPDGSPSRWVIDFGQRSLEVASEYKVPFTRLELEVKPERAKGNIVRRRDVWWQYAAWAPKMRKAVADLDKYLVLTRVSKTVMPMRVPNNGVPSDSLVVFATDRFDDQAVLSSSVHQLWAINRGSGMRNDPRYTPSDVFETFPRPSTTDELDRHGRVLDEERREIMLRRKLGLTVLYNLVNDAKLETGIDPDVDRMREIHVDLDDAVMAAYGWDDVPLDHGFHTYRQMTRWTVSPAARVEILDRLLAENHRRAAEEGTR
ncbi:Eco57I restriction-modification methylase domain-containing protein [Janibacter sp. GS2]|uniref:Eco57I restriction-modification methylase domain-containing protein n=1 Tax=Janibacter sp. GS2 TaxID=3442646 RepID=UPI003EB8F808